MPDPDRDDVVIDVRNAVRTYGPVTALDDVTLSVRPGEVVGLLGPNGAGKTTLINLLLGLRRADAGAVRIFGGDPLDPARRRLLGSTPQDTSLPDTLKVREVVELVAGHFADPVPTDRLLDRFGLLDKASRQCGGLSGGQRRRLVLALAVVGRPHLLILDEPTTGLDVTARTDLWNQVRGLAAEGTTVLMSSHYLEEIEALAERVVVLDRGRVVADDTVHNVCARVGAQVLEFRSPATLDDLPGVLTHTRDGDLHTFSMADSDAGVRALVQTSEPFCDLRIRGASLAEALAGLHVA